jgi:hypothetical protein
MNYIEPRLARLALLHTPCAMLSGPLHLNKAGKWARFGRGFESLASLLE